MNFIASEQEYFQPMLERQIKYSREELDNFRNETVHERRKRVSNEVFNYFNGIVSYGPFKGLKLKENPWWGSSDLGSMCLGLYEKEILDFIFSDQIKNRRTFIDIGAADGYYAIGLLMSNRVDKAVCFELSEQGRETIISNWNSNSKPGQIEVFGDVLKDFPKSLQNIDLSQTFVLVDIEGAEFSFLDSTVLELLSQSIILIEVHNWIDHFFEKYSTFLKNASKYFEIQILPRTEKNTLSFDELRSFTDDNRLLLLSEARPCLMRFLVLKPKIKS